jgi:hypothetical protein
MSTITVCITAEDAMGGCDPQGINVEATQDRLAHICQSALAAAYPDAVVSVSATGSATSWWTAATLSATGTPRYQVTIPWEDMPSTGDRVWLHIQAEEAMEANVQRICEDIWGWMDHWVEAD